MTPETKTPIPELEKKRLALSLSVMALENNKKDCPYVQELSKHYRAYHMQTILEQAKN